MEELPKFICSLLCGKDELSLHSREVSDLAHEFGVYLGLSLRDIKILKFGILNYQGDK